MSDWKIVGALLFFSALPLLFCVGHRVKLGIGMGILTLSLSSLSLVVFGRIIGLVATLLISLGISTVIFLFVLPKTPHLLTQDRSVLFLAKNRKDIHIFGLCWSVVMMIAFVLVPFRDVGDSKAVVKMVFELLLWISGGVYYWRSHRLIAKQGKVPLPTGLSIVYFVLHGIIFGMTLLIQQTLM